MSRDFLRLFDCWKALVNPMPPKRKASSKDSSAMIADSNAKKSKKEAAPAVAKDDTTSETQASKKATKPRAKKATDDGESYPVSYSFAVGGCKLGRGKVLLRAA